MRSHQSSVEDFTQEDWLAGHGVSQGGSDLRSALSTEAMKRVETADIVEKNGVYPYVRRT